MPQHIEVTGERGRRQFEPIADFAHGQPVRTGLYQEAISRQAGVVGQCLQGFNGYALFHSLENIKLFS